MKTEIIKIKWLQRLFFAGFLTLLAAISCVDESKDPGFEANDSDKEKLVTFSLTLPGQPAGGTTYALTTDEEEDVKSIEVLLFGTDGNYIETRIVSEAAISSAGNIKTFTVKIPEGTYSSLVILANSYDMVFGAGLSASDTKTAALAKLEVFNSAKWITDNTSASYRAIPMWGELGHTVVDQLTSQASQSIPWALALARMLAKVSVSLTTPEAIGNFKLQSIRVYNYYDKGSIAPATANWGSGVATAASVPSGAAKPPVATPYTALVYSGNEITTTDISSVNEVYLFESDNQSQSDQSARTCLVLGGVYTTDGQVYYYRVDFVDNADAATDILRNHHYKFNVTKISGPGYDTPDKAFHARPFNIEATVIVWNDTDVKNVSTDGQYMLGVSLMEYDLAMNEYTLSDVDNQLTITTDYPDGWAISSIIDNDTHSNATWLSVAAGDMSGGTTKKTISLLLDTNNSGQARSAKVAVKAGTITVIVQVNQSNAPGLRVRIMDSAETDDITELLFHDPVGTVPTPQQFTVSWMPEASECSITSSAIGANAFNYGSSDILGAGGHVQTSGGGMGTQLFNISPPAINPSDLVSNPFLERISKVDFMITNGIDYINRSIFLRQVNYALEASGHDGVFWMDGTQHSFTVKANDAWKATVTNNADGVLVSLDVTSGSGNPSVGEALRFTLVNGNNESVDSGSFTITFTSVNGKFPAKAYTINCVSGIVWAGSNIYWDGTKLTFDDYAAGGSSTNENKQGVYFKWGSLWGVSPTSNLWLGNNMICYKPDGVGHNVITDITWPSIPRWTGTSIENIEEKYLTEVVHTPENIMKGWGDICKYLTDQAGGTLYGKKWRMPTAKELWNSTSFSNTGSWSLISSNNTAGKYSITVGKIRTDDIGTTFLPASGFRASSAGSSSSIGLLGAYWSSSLSSSSAYCLYFSFIDITLNPSSDRSAALSVRCIQE